MNKYNEFLLEFDNFFSSHNTTIGFLIKEENEKLLNEAIGQTFEKEDGEKKSLLTRAILKAIDLIASFIAYIIYFVGTILKEVRKKVREIILEVKEVKVREVDLSGRDFIWKGNEIPKYTDFDRLNIDYLKTSDPVSRYNEIKDSVLSLVSDDEPITNKMINISYRDFENFLNFLTNIDPIIVKLMKGFKKELSDLSKEVKIEGNTKESRLTYNDIIVKMNALNVFERYSRIAFVDFSFAVNRLRKYGNKKEVEKL